MASRKTLIRRFLAAASRPQAPAGSPAAPSPLRRVLPRGGGLLRRSLHQIGAFPAERLAFPVGERLIERLRSIDGHRIRLGQLAPPPDPVEAVRGRLREISEGSISYERFVELCGEVSCEGDGERIARALDEAGDVLVLGNVVFLRPEQVARAIQCIIPPFLTTKTPRTPPADDPRWSELEELEKVQAAIDVRATAGVRRELWGGLAYLVAQTAVFMRLTFWELSWDVMEPICFYVTSMYFMAGYGFFLRTSKDPSFEGFFESRFAARRHRIMKAEGFDPLRLQELRRSLGVCRPSVGREFCDFYPRTVGDLQLHPRNCGCHRRDGLDLDGALIGRECF